MSDGRILVTGATGFVGRHMVARLLAERSSLTLAVREITGCPPSWCHRPDIRLVETGDIETCANLEDALSGVSAVVHLAGLAHIPGGDSQFMAANALATEKLAHASAQAGIRTFIHASSLSAITENTSTTDVDDQTDTVPSTPYGRSKRAAEAHVHGLSERGICSVSLRPPVIAGPDAKGNWGLLQRLTATGLPLPFGRVRNRRSLIGVDSVTRAIAHLCSRPWPVEKSGAYCIADHGPLSLAEIVAELRFGMGLPARLVPFPPSALHALAGIAKQQHRAAALLGDLKVDSSRFTQAFEVPQMPDARHSVRESGRLYRLLQSGALEGPVPE